MRNDQYKLNDHQNMLLSMLKDLDAVCRRHGIRYQLFSGTALGAVRHHGFIPWDDDLDVIMLREDYERFLSAAESDLDASVYFVQRELSAHWPMQFSKLRRNGTACMEKSRPRDSKMHQGVYVDIFPCDDAAKSPLIRRLQYLSSRIVVAKCLDARGYETDSLLKKCFMLVCRLLPLALLRRFCVKRRPSSSMVHTFFAAGSKYEKNVFERAWFTESVSLPFEDGEYPVSAHYDALLTKLYGDYHRIPSPEERKVKEHLAIMDLDRPWQDYLEQQRTMVFDGYSRSIR